MNILTSSWGLLNFIGSRASILNKKYHLSTTQAHHSPPQFILGCPWLCKAVDDRYAVEASIVVPGILGRIRMCHIITN